ncbi:MAG: hypothetical protein HGA44_20790, partial [Cellulomonadaceae bacterium]|nr:hypothetical protein [Cellulomonadaceae bacterium]
MDLARSGQQPVAKIASDLGISESCLRRWVVEPAGEHRAVVGQDLLGDAMAVQRVGQPLADEPGALGRHQPRRDAVPGMVVDTGQTLGRSPVHEHHPGDHVHLPQLHR